MLKDKRVILAGLLMIGLAVSFWAGSRVPALNEKALMGGDTQLDALGFDTVFQVQPTDSVVVKTLKTTVNWIQTNKKGMTFGVLFGAVLMTVLSLLRKKSTESGFANTLLGMAIGAPLGVCVNCAAPVAQGMREGGAKVETMLAAMVSSPTLNVIVLTMLFSLFPAYMIAIKLGLTLTFILVGIPILTRIFFKDRVLSGEAEAELMGDAACEIPFWENPPERWLEACRWVTVNFGKNLGHIVVKTVPLMFLAGLLGASVITVLPWDTLSELVPDRGPLFAFGAMGAVAAVGLFLPVPISFDVLVPAILMAAGFPVKYAMILLFTLGIFSIYPFFIVWNSVGKTMAIAICGVLALMGIGAGVGGGLLFERATAEQQQIIFDVLGTKQEDAKGPTFLYAQSPHAAEPDEPLFTSLVAGVAASPVSMDAPEGFSVERIAFEPRGGRSSAGARFVRRPGPSLGLDAEGPLTVMSFASVSRFRSISTGDVHGDGWPDVLTASGGALLLYANRGGEQFVRQQLELGDVDAYVVNAALVDIDDDGWLDIFMATFRGGNHILFNRQGSFTAAPPKGLPNRGNAQMTGAVAFGDVDRDGDLDIALGNYTLGSLAGSWTSDSARNAWLEQVNGEFRVHPLDGLPGESQTALLSDIDADGSLDLMVGNDFNPPDDIYLNDGAGGLDRVNKQRGLFPHTAWSTMSIDTADVNNDLELEIYMGQITGFAGQTGIQRRKIEPRTCSEFSDEKMVGHCEQVMKTQRDLVASQRRKDPRVCFQVDSRFQEDCVALQLLASAARWNRDQSLCDLFPEAWEAFEFMCNESFRESVTFQGDEERLEIPQLRDKNPLLMRGDDGVYQDVAADFGVQTGAWTWTAKFADLDNDEWQDLYIVNGDFPISTRESNIFFLNEQGKHFTDSTVEMGFESFLATTSYSYVDYDLDGDIDIIALPVIGTAFVYENQTSDNRAVAFELRDERANRFGLGSQVVVHYGPDGSRHQLREIKSGGGFVSYDAPLAHFGLGEFDRVERVEVRWSTGEMTELEGPFSAGARYRIRRGSGGPEKLARGVGPASG